MDVYNDSIKKLDYELRIRNWSVKVHKGQTNGLNTGDYMVAR